MAPARKPPVLRREKLARLIAQLEGRLGFVEAAGPTAYETAAKYKQVVTYYRNRIARLRKGMEATDEDAVD